MLWVGVKQVHLPRHTNEMQQLGATNMGYDDVLAVVGDHQTRLHAPVHGRVKLPRAGYTTLLALTRGSIHDGPDLQDSQGFMKRLHRQP